MLALLSAKGQGRRLSEEEEASRRREDATCACASARLPPFTPRASPLVSSPYTPHRAPASGSQDQYEARISSGRQLQNYHLLTYVLACCVVVEGNRAPGRKRLESSGSQRRCERRPRGSSCADGSDIRRPPQSLRGDGSGSGIGCESVGRNAGEEGIILCFGVVGCIFASRGLRLFNV